MNDGASTSSSSTNTERDKSSRRSCLSHDLESFRHVSVADASEADTSAVNTDENESRNQHRGLPHDPQQTPTTTNKEVVQETAKDSGKKSKSEVWQHYAKIDSTSAKCNICLKLIKHGGNTTNMMQHLKHAHSLHVPLKKKHTKETASRVGNVSKRVNDAEGYNSAEDADDPPQKRQKLTESQSQAKSNKSEKIANAFQRMSSLHGRGSSATKITTAILYMISVDNLPLSTVENKGFQKLMKTIVPLYSVPSRKTTTKELEIRYEELKSAFRDNLLLDAIHTLTCDIWTDTANQSYLGITDQYLTPTLEIKHGCLGVIPLSERHTAAYISRNLQDCLDSFGIETSRVTAIVTDCGANIKKAANDIFGTSKHIPCLAHVLSHVVPNVLKTLPEIESIFTRVQSIVTITKRSVVASDELKRLQICNGKTEGTALKLKQDVPTRWNSTFYMIERFLGLRDYMYPILLKCPTAPEMLTREEIQILEDCVLLLRPIESVITEISGEKYPTGSVAIPIIRCMERALSHCTPATTAGKCLKSKLIDKVEEKFVGIEKCELLAIATILNPCFKKMHFRSALAASAAIATINRAIKSASSDRAASVAPASQPSENATGGSIWDFHDNLIASNTASGNDTSEIHLELRQYLHQPLISRHACPFGYWRSVKNAFPALYSIAVKHLNVIATSVPSERLFSKAGALKTERRNRLSDGTTTSVRVYGKCQNKENRVIDENISIGRME